MSDAKLGPHVKRLLSYKMAKDAIPDGGGFADGVKFLSSKESIVAGFQSATEWIKAALLAVRQAGEPNPWKDATDEEIAAHIIERLEKRVGGAQTR
jgi:hypothetical protein